MTNEHKVPAKYLGVVVGVVVFLNPAKAAPNNVQNEKINLKIIDFQ